MTKRFFACWNDDHSLPYSRRGVYVAVSGNTGSGKSTLIERTIKKISPTYDRIIGINERALHHPLLKLMFHSPSEYAFVVQLYFLIQRYSMIYRWLSIGYSVFIERSHVDDMIFVEHYCKLKHITHEQFEIYFRLTENLHKKIPDPDIYVYLDIKPKLSLLRLKKAEDAKERPKEFPSEKTKREYIHSWYKLYNELFDRIVDQKRNGITFKETTIMHWLAKNDLNPLISELTEKFFEKTKSKNEE